MVESLGGALGGRWDHWVPGGTMAHGINVLGISAVGITGVRLGSTGTTAWASLNSDMEISCCSELACLPCEISHLWLCLLLLLLTAIARLSGRRSRDPRAMLQREWHEGRARSRVH